MKSFILLTFLLFINASFANGCQTDQGYLNSGWNVSYPQDFDAIYQELKKDLDQGLQAGVITSDLDGVIYTSNAVDSSRVYMRTQTWDSAETPTDEMYGDIAIFSNKFNPSEILEIRWYAKGMKFVAVNSTYLNCVSIAAPLAVNVMF